MREFIRVTPKYLNSLTQRIVTLVDDFDIFLHILLHLGPMRIQLHFLKLIDMSRKLVINTNLPLILHCFQVMADYMSNFP